MKQLKKVIFAAMLLIVAVFIFAACSVNAPAISSVELVDGTYQTEYVVGQTPALVGAQLKVIFTDGTVDYVVVTSEMAQVFDASQNLVFTFEDDIEADENCQGYVITNQEMIANYNNFIVRAVASVATNNYISITAQGVVTGYGRGLTNEIVVIPQTATSGSSTVAIKTIGQNAFNGASIAGVILPASIQALQQRAFANCVNLRTVLFLAGDDGNSSLTSVGNYVFQNDALLQSVDLPKSITGLSANTFSGCSALKAINIEGGGENYYTPYNTSYSGAVYAVSIGVSEVAFANAWIWPEGKGYSTVNFISEEGVVSFSAPAGEILDAPVVDKDYYELDGWYRDETLTQKATVLIAEDNDYNLYPKWLPIEYGITYNLNGGQNNASNPDTYNYEDSVALVPPTKNGYDFAGWSDEGVISLNSHGERTFTASWTPIYYEIIYDLNGGVNYIGNPLEYTIETASFNLGTPEKEGFTFAGWFTDAVFVGVPFALVERGSTGKIELWAKWMIDVYHVEYILHGGTHSNPLVYDVEDEINLTAPMRSGYEFVGWTHNEGEEITQSAAIEIGTTGEQTFEAHWAILIYGLTYTVNGGVLHSGTVFEFTIEDSVPLYVPTRMGYTFKGWFTNGDFIGESVNAVTAGTYKNLEFYAKWEANTYTVIYNSNMPSIASGSLSGTMQNTSHIYDTASALRNNAYTLIGWTFKGWATSANGAVQYLNVADVSTLAESGTVTLYAKWEANTYTVIYNSNKPSTASGNVSGTMENTPHTYDSASALRNNAFTLTGWTFKGWATSVNGDVVYTNGQSVTKAVVSDAVTLYAKWEANGYTITYDSNMPINAGGTISGSTVTSSHVYDVDKVLTANGYQLTGWTFKGWATSSTDAVIYSNAQLIKNQTEQVNGTVALYAVWEANTYKITYYYDGATSGNIASECTVTYDSAYTLAKLAKTGYTFGGWFSAVNGGGLQYTNANGNSFSNWTLTTPLDLYAYWIENSYTLQFNANAGNDDVSGDLSSKSLTYTEIYSLSSRVLTRIGYEFMGWKTAVNGTSVVYNKTASVDKLTATNEGTFTLYAHWQAYTYTIVYNGNSANGGSMTADTNLEYGKSYVLKTNGYTYTGHEFLGWSRTQGVSNTKEFDNKAQISNLTTVNNGIVNLYAVWQEETYSLNFVFKDTLITEITGEYTIPTVIDADKKVTYGQNYNLPVPSRKGYTFEGWYLNKNGSAYTTKLTYGVKDLIANPNTVIIGRGDTYWAQDISTTSATDVYAKWEIVTYEVKLYKEQYDYTVTNLFDTISFNINQTKTVPPFAYYGYAFKDWKLAGSTTLLNGNSTTPFSTFATGIALRTYANVEKNTTAELSDRITGTLSLSAFVEENGEKQNFDRGTSKYLGSSLTGYDAVYNKTNGIVLIDFAIERYNTQDKINNEFRLPVTFTIAAETESITFFGNGLSFVNFNIIVAVRGQKPLMIGFSSFNFAASMNNDAVNAYGDFDLTIKYNGTNSIHGGNGSNGEQGSQGTNTSGIGSIGATGSNGASGGYKSQNEVNGKPGDSGGVGIIGGIGGNGSNGLDGKSALKVNKVPSFIRETSSSTIAFIAGNGGQGGQGGKGGKGQTGGQGGTGGNGTSSYHFYFIGVAWTNYGVGGNGGKGGVGGTGGTGGNGGAGGAAGSAIEYSTGSAPTNNVNGCTFVAGVSGAGGTKGVGGDGGTGGAGGIGGAGAKGGAWNIIGGLTSLVNGIVEAARSGGSDAGDLGAQGDSGSQGSYGSNGNAGSTANAIKKM
jgi:uncharacterized repeat protein (TIGR02543 family)